MKKIICYVFGHRYKLKRKVSASIYELTCKRCKQEFGMNTSCRSLLRMDAELKQLHSEIDIKG